jgi:hypothetical protein
VGEQLMNAWWLYIRTPSGNFCWSVGSPPSDDVVNAARVVTGFPAHDDWAEDGSGFDLSTAPGDPHAEYLQRHQPTIGTLAALLAVDRAAVAEHAAARAEWGRARDVEVVATMLSTLDTDTLAAVLADPAVAEAVAATRKGVA